jgi:hypothetical protein
MKLLYARDNNLLRSGILECCLALGLWVVLQSVAAAGTSATPGSTPSQDSEAAARPPEAAVHSAVAKGANEWGLMTGGALGLPGGAMSHGLWMIDLRWGRVLTGVHGPGPLRGTLEYALEVVPVLVVRQSTAVFGSGFNPLLLQYNFVASHKIVPFVQVGAGTLLTERMVPARSSDFNFTPQGGFGIYLFRRPKTAFSVGVRYHHISNAGIRKPNPGINSMYFYSGLSWWK